MRPSWAARLKRWREDDRGILQFVDEELKATPDPWQERACLAFADPDPQRQRISLQACAGPGKSAVLAWCGWWFLGTQGEIGEHPKGAATSITSDNLKTNLWAEFAKWQPRSSYLSHAFTHTAGAIFANDHPATWRLDAKAWPKTANADEQGKTLSGLHSKYVLILIDESGAIPTTVLRAGEQALSSTAFGKIMQAGNPISLDGMLHAAATSLRHQWHVIRITGDPDEPDAWVHTPRLATLHRPGPDGLCACPACWAREQITTYGRENPWVKSYILGQFPPASINALLGIEEVEAAMKRHYRSDQYQWAQKRLGVDVARFGDDRTVLFPRQGIAAFKPDVIRQQRTTTIASRVARALDVWGGEVLVLIDDTGHWGHGAVDILVTSGKPVVPVIASTEATNRRYHTMRDEMWMSMADWVKKGGALPPLPDMVAELTTPTYTFMNGKFRVEPKDQVKARLGRSPDLADALAQTFALPDAPSDIMEKLTGRNRTVHEFNPFDVAAESYGRDLAQMIRQAGRVEHDFDPFAE